MEKSIFRNTIYKVLLNVCNIIIPVLVGPYITRVLDKDVYGIYNSTNATFSVFLIVGAFGIYNYGLREISRVRDNKEKTQKLFNELLIISLISNAIVSGVYIAYALMTTTGYTTLLYGLFAIQFVGNAVYIEWINEAMENYSFITLKTVIIRLIYVAAIFLFIRKGSDLIPYTLIMSLSYTLNCVVSFVYVIQKVPLCFKGLDLKQHLKPLFIVFVIMNVTILYTQSDKIMLGTYVSDVEVSVYQIPHYIMGMINSLAVAVAAVSIPRLSHVLHNQGERDFLNLHRTISHSFLFMLFPACMGVLVLSKEIILLYGSEKYLECVIPMALFSLVFIPNAYSYLYGDTFLFITGHERTLAFFHFIGGMTNVTLNFLLIKMDKFNASTSIITLTIAFTLVALICYLYIRLYLKVRVCVLDKTIVRYILLSLSFIPIAWAIKLLELGTVLTAGLTMLSCGTVYIGVLALCKDDNIQIIGRKLSGIIRRIRSK